MLNNTDLVYIRTLQHIGRDGVDPQYRRLAARGWVRTHEMPFTSSWSELTEAARLYLEGTRAKTNNP